MQRHVDIQYIITACGINNWTIWYESTIKGRLLNNNCVQAMEKELMVIQCLSVNSHGNPPPPPGSLCHQSSCFSRVSSPLFLPSADWAPCSTCKPFLPLYKHRSILPAKGSWTLCYLIKRGRVRPPFWPLLSGIPYIFCRECVIRTLLCLFQGGFVRTPLSLLWRRCVRTPLCLLYGLCLDSFLYDVL